MSATSTPAIEQLLASLSRGWASSAGAASVFSGLLSKHLSCDVAALDVGLDVVSFRLNLYRIHLRGMDDVFCVGIGGGRSETVEFVRTAIRTHMLPGRIILAFILNDFLVDQIKLVCVGQRCVPIANEDLRNILEADDSTARLIDIIRQFVPQRVLIPYDILRSASGNMFFGRLTEFRRLRDEDTTSFAVAGPGRAGKTSLVKHYVRSLKEESSPRGSATHYIDLMECPDKTADGYARFLSRRVGLKRSERMTAAELLIGFRSHVGELGQPVNLVLDESDDLCLDDDISEVLATAARNELVRLVICGRGDLFRTMLDPDSHYAERLELLRIGPLEEEPARSLLIKPLADLGIRISNHKLVDQVMHLTGRLPHLIQLFARRFTEHLIEENRDELDETSLEAMRYDYELAQYTTSPLEDLRDPLARVLAIEILRDQRKMWMTPEIAHLIPGLTINRALDLCNELVISNILTWHFGGFRLANEAMRMYALESGYF